MIKLDRTAYSESYIHFLYLLAPFQAGYINAAAFNISAGYFVSHVTGTSTMIGMGVAELDPKIFITFTIILLSFILGAGFSGFHIKHKEEKGENTNFSLVMFVKFIFFGIVLTLSELDLITNSETYIKLSHTFMLFLLSFCCGIQNSSSSLATGGFLKPTHMTGLSTDVGTNLYLFFVRDKKRQAKEFKDLKMRINILLSFITGGVFAQVIFLANGHYAFLFPFMSSLFFLLLSLTSKTDEHRSVLNLYQVCLGLVFLLTVGLGIFSIFSRLE